MEVLIWSVIPVCFSQVEKFLEIVVEKHLITEVKDTTNVYKTVLSFDKPVGSAETTERGMVGMNWEPSHALHKSSLQMSPNSSVESTATAVQFHKPSRARDQCNSNKLCHYFPHRQRCLVRFSLTDQFRNLNLTD